MTGREKIRIRIGNAKFIDFDDMPAALKALELCLVMKEFDDISAANKALELCRIRNRQEEREQRERSSPTLKPAPAKKKRVRKNRPKPVMIEKRERNLVAFLECISQNQRLLLRIISIVNGSISSSELGDYFKPETLKNLVDQINERSREWFDYPFIRFRKSDEDRFWIYELSDERCKKVDDAYQKGTFPDNDETFLKGFFSWYERSSGMQENAKVH